MASSSPCRVQVRCVLNVCLCVENANYAENSDLNEKYIDDIILDRIQIEAGKYKFSSCKVFLVALYSMINMIV